MEQSKKVNGHILQKNDVIKKENIQNNDHLISKIKIQSLYFETSLNIYTFFSKT
jgi:hypothetical protein